jgi:hypothetical protein
MLAPIQSRPLASVDTVEGMAEPLIVTVPDSVESSYLVAAPRHVPDDLGGIARLWASRMSGLEPAPGQPEPGTLQVALAGTSPLPAAEQLHRAGNAPDLVQRVTRSDSCLVVRYHGWPGWPARPATISHGVANALAFETEGLVLDPHTNRVLRPRRQGEWDLTGPPFLHRLPLGDWTRAAYQEGDRLILLGMERFGVPNLETPGVPPDLVEAWGTVLRAVAGVVLNSYWSRLADEPHRAFVELDNPLWVGDSTHTLVRLALDIDPGRFQTVQVLPPEEFPDGYHDWLRATIASVLPTGPQG